MKNLQQKQKETNALPKQKINPLSNKSNKLSNKKTIPIQLRIIEKKTLEETLFEEEKERKINKPTPNTSLSILPPEQKVQRDILVTINQPEKKEENSKKIGFSKQFAPKYKIELRERKQEVEKQATESKASSSSKNYEETSTREQGPIKGTNKGYVPFAGEHSKYETNGAQSPEKEERELAKYQVDARIQEEQTSISKKDYSSFAQTDKKRQKRLG